MSSFFSSLATKAQSAYEQSPIAGQVSQLQTKISSPSGSAENPTANQAAAQGGVGARSQMLGTITHQFRNIQMQYANVPPVQRIITSQKGVALDFESVAKDSKSQSKELYMWGQTEDDDIKDVTDRLAFLNFVHGSMSSTLSSELDSSRKAMKALRDAEKVLEPKRNSRAGLQGQIARLEHDQQKGSEKRMADFKEQLTRLEAEDANSEKEIAILKRKAVADSERAKWAALREYGEKLVLLAEASTSIIDVLPSIPPTKAQPYTGAKSTASTRASLQHALDNFKPGSISHSFQPSAADIDRSESRSFGVTHATELSNIDSSSQPAHSQSAHTEASAPHPLSHQPSGPKLSPPPVNPAALNNAPAPIPHKSSPSSHVEASEAIPIIPQENVASSPTSGVSTSPIAMKTVPLHAPEPTIAETGVPVSAGDDGPGPASGSLKDLKSPIPPSAAALTSGSVPGYGPGFGQPATKLESAEEEKARLQREDRERLLRDSAPAAPSGSTPSYAPGPGQHAAKLESAEEEKTRLQREERERLLRESGTGAPAPKFESADEEKKRLEKEERDRLIREQEYKLGGSGNKDTDGDGATPPPYQDL